jgi:outer membrane receptor protein involved in Fe transport
MNKMGLRKRTTVILGCAALGLNFTVHSVHAYAAEPQRSYSIASQDLGSALRAFAVASGRDVVFDPILVKDKTTQELHGELTDEEALRRILAGSGLTFERTASGGFVVHPLKQDPAADSMSNATNSVYALDEVVVTGTAVSIDKFTAPYAISTQKEQAILDKAPRSLADLLRNQPGITVENSGGEGGFENLVIRGLPYIGWRLIDVLQDGVPLYESNWEKYLNIDETFRVDLMTERAEVERGGTASIFSNNASGGVLNLITRHGTPEPEGALQVEGGTDSLLRVSGYQSGPITDNLLYSIGGSYRRDDGLRNQGFTGDKGGQIQAGATYLIPNGKGKLFADVKYLNDKSVVYTDIPLTNPLTGSSLSSLINPNTGTLTSSSFENVNLRTLNGTPGGAIVSRNLSNGIHPAVTTVTLGGDYDLGAGWTITDRARYMDGTIGFDAIFNAATPSNASSFLSSYLTAAQAAFPGTTRLDYSIVGSGAEYNPATTAGLVMANSYYAIQTKIRDVINDVHAAKTFDMTDTIKDDLTVGFYSSSYYFSQQEYLNAILTNVENNPNALDIRALSPSGAVLGYITENGFLSYGSGSLNGSLHGTALAGYLENAVHITPDWQVDAGVRTELRQQSGVQGVLGTQNVDPTGPLAAQSVKGVVSYTPHHQDQHGTAYTFGTAYDISSNLNGFVRYSHAYSFPQFTTIYGGASGLLPNGQPVPVSTVNQAEGGLKFKTSTFQAAATVYYAHFNQLSSTAQVAASNGSIVNSPIVFNSTTIGVEAEADWRPVRSFDLSGTVTLQDPKIDAVQTLTGLSAASSVNDVIPRVPTYYISLEPAYIFQFGNWRGSAFADVAAIGKRYQDVSNLSVLPAYTTLDLGVTANPTDRVELRLLVSNVTDSAGLTEGNARGSALGVGTVGDATVGRPIFGRQVTGSVLYRW